MYPVLFTLPIPGFPVPFYSYGVLLGLSLVVGWYLTLALAERDGLPHDQMADCYVDTALFALIGSRVLFVITNWDREVAAIADAGVLGYLSLLWPRNGGLVAYGGFLGGFVGSYLFLRHRIGFTVAFRSLLRRVGIDPGSEWQRIPLLPWADVAVPSLASGLLITRIGCYLYGCDFGMRLGEGAPAFLRKLGTFPRWPDGLVDTAGSPAFVQHVVRDGLSIDATASYPVHPTQLYESLVGLALLVVLLKARRHQTFRGQIFFLFTFLYGACRFLLELWRDDMERGNVPPSLPRHFLFPLCLAAFAAAYAVGIAPSIRAVLLRRVSMLLAFAPAIVAYTSLRPRAFVAESTIALSTSQFVGLVSAIAVAIAYRLLRERALIDPRGAMALPEPIEPSRDTDAPNAPPEGDASEEEASIDDVADPSPEHAAAPKIEKTSAGKTADKARNKTKTNKKRRSSGPR